MAKKSGPKKKPSILRHRFYAYAVMRGKGNRPRSIHKDLRDAMDARQGDDYCTRVMVMTEHSLGPDYEVDPIPVKIEVEDE